MDGGTTSLERAFQLAKSGTCATIDDLKRRLHAENYSLAQITGPVLFKQLRALMHTARGVGPEVGAAAETVEKRRMPSIPLPDL
jgi:hypothetical protein